MFASDLSVLLVGVAEQFALAEAAMNAWPSPEVTDRATTSTVQLQGMNVQHKNLCCFVYKHTQQINIKMHK